MQKGKHKTRVVQPDGSIYIHGVRYVHEKLQDLIGVELDCYQINGGIEVRYWNQPVCFAVELNHKERHHERLNRKSAA